MLATLSDWLARTGTLAFTWAVAGFVVVNVVALVAVVLTRDRTLVNRWTGRVLGVNLGLLALGAGVPAATWTARQVVALVAGVVPTSPVEQEEPRTFD
jgi:aspartate ammonia-lyase